MVNLYVAIHNDLKEHSSILSDRFYNKFKTQITAKQPNPNQIPELNHYWRMVFGVINEDTLKERSCLIDNVTADIWLVNFRRYVLDSILKYGLPYSSLDVR